MSLSYFNAAATSNFRNAGIFIKYGDYGKFEIVRENVRQCHMILPDREVFITTDGYTSENPFLWGWDEFVDLNIFSKNARQHNILINHCDFEVSKESILEKQKNKGPRFLCDSGGFQIAAGRIDIINPIDLVKFYNKNSELGMILDIPVYCSGLSDELIERLALVQKRNTDYLLKYKEPGVELINVVHGSSYEQKLKFFDIIYTPEIQRLALPSVNIDMDIPRLNFILELLRRAKQKGGIKHLHLLGTFSKGLLLTAAKLANTKIPELEGISFTTDSSSALFKMKTLVYLKNINIFDGLDKFSPNKNEKFTQVFFNKSSYPGNLQAFNPYAELPCQCPACRALRYSYALRNLNFGSTRNTIFYYHNTLECENFVSMIDTFAKNLSWQEYLEMVGRLHDADDTTTIKNIKFLKDVEEMGLDKAREKYKNFLREDQTFASLLKSKQSQGSSQTDKILSLIEKYENIDFENYKGKVSLGTSTSNVRVSNRKAAK